MYNMACFLCLVCVYIMVLLCGFAVLRKIVLFIQRSRGVYYRFVVCILLKKLEGALDRRKMGRVRCSFFYVIQNTRVVN